jgi:uroporphyrin-III C-methyltransferase/precorrin-2 dehydrogenase/sirohydrochlorin ferrochelatase
VVVVGGGPVAAGRVEALLASGARVRVIAPEASAGIRKRAEEGRITLEGRAYRPGDLEGARLVMAATDQASVNAAVWEETRRRGIQANVADDPARCDFFMPALVRRGDLSVAISTGGRSPAVAAWLRARLQGLIGPEYGRLVEILGAVRERVGDPARRKALQYRLLESGLLGSIRRGEEEEVRQRIDRELSGESASTEGRVYIVGAGPGDPALITLRGMECLAMSDVVLHDRLIDSRLIGLAREGAEIVDVGKRPGDQGRMQRFIESTMVARARQGLRVCRLKGGDPFVFGRGGEEASALAAARIAFEIVPGVTSATAAPASAGIPVTHRDIAHSFLVMTGSRAPQAGSAEWSGAAALVGAGGTLVILMGLAHLPTIVGRLSAAGCGDETPAAIVSRGTCPDEEIRVGTLGTIAALGRDAPSPGVIVFGEVVREREKLLELSPPRSRG